MPALLVAGAFVLPLLSRTVEWFGLPRELRIVLPLVIGVAALARFEQVRRNSAIDSERQGASEGEPRSGRAVDSQNASE